MLNGQDILQGSTWFPLLGSKLGVPVLLFPQFLDRSGIRRTPLTITGSRQVQTCWPKFPCASLSRIFCQPSVDSAEGSEWSLRSRCKWGLIYPPSKLKNIGESPRGGTPLWGWEIGALWGGGAVPEFTEFGIPLQRQPFWSSMLGAVQYLTKMILLWSLTSQYKIMTPFLDKESWSWSGDQSVQDKHLQINTNSAGFPLIHHQYFNCI